MKIEIFLLVFQSKAQIDIHIIGCSNYESGRVDTRVEMKQKEETARTLTLQGFNEILLFDATVSIPQSRYKKGLGMK